MTIEDISKICHQFPHVTEDIKWENHLCFCVGEKMFIVTAPDASPVSASFKADDEDFVELTERDGFIPAPYMARYKWVYVDNISRLNKKEWEIYLHKAYTMVAEKLPGKLKKSLGIGEPIQTAKTSTKAIKKKAAVKKKK
jgi:predicted DNA-binding protein (MmcQ/YjbR family)